MRFWNVLLPMALAACAMDCPGPQVSLEPLYSENEAEVVFDERLLGKWEGTENEVFTFEKQGEKAYRLTFRAGGSDPLMVSEFCLVRLGPHLFFDAMPAKRTAKEEKMLEEKHIAQPFPLVGGHVFGRIRIEVDYVRLSMLQDEWVREAVSQNMLTLGKAGHGSETVLTASTEELQEFALAHAEDWKAFAGHIQLCPAGRLEENACMIAALRDLTEFDPEKKDNWRKLGRAYVAEERYEEASAALSRANVSNDELASLLDLAGLARLGQVQFEEARVQFRRSLQTRSTVVCPDAQALIGLSYVMEARYAEGAGELEKCVRERPEPLAIAWYGLALRHVGKEVEAQKHLEEAARKAPAKSWEAALLGFLQGRVSEKKTLAAAKKPWQKADFYFFAGEQYLLKGNETKAREYYQKAVKTREADCEGYIAARARLAQMKTQ